MRVLIVDDDAGLRKSLSLILQEAGHETLIAQDGAEGLMTAAAQLPDVVLCDVRMPGMGGLDFLQQYRESGGEALVLVMTAYGSVETAVEAMKRGAVDFLPQPFSMDHLTAVVTKAAEVRNLREENRELRATVWRQHERT